MEAPNLLLVNLNQANWNGLFVFWSVCNSVDTSHVHHVTSILCHETGVDNWKGCFHFLVGHSLATLELHMIQFYTRFSFGCLKIGKTCRHRRFHMLEDLRHVFCRGASWKVDNKLMLLERQLLTPPKFNIAPLKSYPPKRKVVFNNHRFSGAMLNFRCVLYLIWGSFSYESLLVMADAYMFLFVSLQEQLTHFRGRMNPPAFWWSKVARLHFQWIKTAPRSILLLKISI